MAEVVGYARVSSTGQDLTTQLEKLGGAGCMPENIFKEKRSGTDRGRPELQRCLGYVRRGDTLLVSKLDRLARSTVDLYNIVAQLQAKGVEFKVIDDPSIDTTSRTGKLVMGILALIAEFENDIRRERQLDGIARPRTRRSLRRSAQAHPQVLKKIRKLRRSETVPEIMRQTGLSKASVYRALSRGAMHSPT